MLGWLFPVALFWLLAALYLGASPISMKGGGAVQQILGLLLFYVVYLAVYGGLRAVLLGPLGEIFGGVVFPLLVASALIPVLGKVTFRVVGVRIVPAAGH